MSKNKYYCRIDGKIYNLEKIQDVIDNSSGDLDKAEIFMVAVEEYGLPMDNLLGYVIEFNNNEIPSDYNEALKRMQDRNQAQVQRMVANKPKCPTCNSTNVKPISGSERAVSVIGLGLFSKKIGKSYKCLNCKHTW